MAKVDASHCKTEDEFRRFAYSQPAGTELVNTGFYLQNFDGYASSDVGGQYIPPERFKQPAQQDNEDGKLSDVAWMIPFPILWLPMMFYNLLFRRK